jgi:hypothetical protein
MSKTLLGKVALVTGGSMDWVRRPRRPLRIKVQLLRSVMSLQRKVLPPS